MEISELLLTSSHSSQQSSVCLWDYNTLNVHKLYKNGGTAPPKCLEIVGDDYILTAELGKPLLHVWPLNSQDQAKNIRLILPEPATCLALCPKSTYLAIGIDCKVYVWHISSGKLLSVQQKHFQPVTTVKFSSDGEYLLIGGQDGMLVAYIFGELVSISSNYLTQTDIGLVEPAYTKSDHSMPITDIHIGSFGKKSRFATVSTDQTCRIYSLLTGEALLTLTFNEQLTSVTLDDPCWRLFVGSNLGNIYQFNLKNPPRTLSHHVEDKDTSLNFKGHKKKIVSLRINMSGTFLASASEDNFVYIWEMKSRQILKKIEHKNGVTNIRFVTGFQNFFAENLKPQVVMKSLERSLDTSKDFVVSRVQTNDIELSDDENCAEKCIFRQDLEKENRKLRAANKQLYEKALEISKKYNSLKKDVK